MLTEGYLTLTNLVMGGSGAALLICILLWRASKVAATGNTAKMVTWPLAPAALAALAAVALVTAGGYGWSKLQTAFNSPQAADVATAGLKVVTSVDGLLNSAGGTVQTASFDTSMVQSSVAGALNGMTWATGSTAFTSQAQALLATATAWAAEPAEAAATPTPQMVAARVNMPANSTQNTAANVDWSQVTVRPGDSMGAIAARHGVNLMELCGMNASTVPNCAVVKAGQVVKLPLASNGQPVREIVPVAKVAQANYVAPTPVPAVAQAVTSGGKTYTIKAGDNLFSIIARTGVDGYKLCNLNRATMGDNCDKLAVGATLALP